MKLRKYVKTTFLKCPKCGRLYPNLFTMMGEWRCVKCGYHTTNIKDWPKADKKVLSFKCKSCGDYVENTNDNVNWLGVFREIVCPTCLQTVAINGKHVLEQAKITKIDLDASEQISKSLYLSQVKTRRQNILLRLLNLNAKKEENSFKNLPRPRIEKSKNIQYVITTRNKLVGYLSFTPKWKEGTSLVNQVYVIPEERRKGYATKLFQYFIERNCDNSSKTWFIVESPNEKTHNLIVNKLGLGDKVASVFLG